MESVPATLRDILKQLQTLNKNLEELKAISASNKEDK
jgi:hypothetical protein